MPARQELQARAQPAHGRLGPSCVAHAWPSPHLPPTVCPRCADIASPLLPSSSRRRACWCGPRAAAAQQLLSLGVALGLVPGALAQALQRGVRVCRLPADGLRPLLLLLLLLLLLRPAPLLLLLLQLLPLRRPQQRGLVRHGPHGGRLGPLLGARSRLWHTRACLASSLGPLSCARPLLLDVLRKHAMRLVLLLRNVCQLLLLRLLHLLQQQRRLVPVAPRVVVHGRRGEAAAVPCWVGQRPATRQAAPVRRLLGWVLLRR